MLFLNQEAFSLLLLADSVRIWLSYLHAIVLSAPYEFNRNISAMPSLTTVKVMVPTSCPPPKKVTRPVSPSKAGTGCACPATSVPHVHLWHTSAGSNHCVYLHLLPVSIRTCHAIGFKSSCILCDGSRQLRISSLEMPSHKTDSTLQDQR